MRLIDADALKSKLKIDTNTATYSDYCNGYCDARQVDIDAIDAAPTIAAEPVRNGRWIVRTTWHGMFGLIHSECSVCNFDRNGDLSAWKLCPNCGARMDGGDNNVLDQ